MSVGYCDGGAGDLAAVDRLFRESFVATFGHLYAPADLAAFLGRFTPDAWRAEFDQPGTAFRLAERGGRIVGFAKIGALTIPVAAAGAAVELRQLYLAEEAKGAGIGAALLDWTIAAARARGAGELFLTVYVDNARARALYERRGFVDVGRYDFHVGEHLDEDRIMRLTL